MKRAAEVGRVYRRRPYWSTAARVPDANFIPSSFMVSTVLYVLDIYLKYIDLPVVGLGGQER